MRGIDTEGHVANFVETEQIAIHGTIKASFVQVQCMCYNYHVTLIKLIAWNCLH